MATTRQQIEAVPATADSAEIQAVSDWLIHQGLHGAEFAHTLEGFCERIVALGVPLRRAFIGMRTLHPSVDALTFTWRREEGVRQRLHGIDQREDDTWRLSPLRQVMESGGRPLRRILSGPGAELDFPILAELAGLGYTDYAARITAFEFGEGAGNNGMASSWATDAPGGFSDGCIAVLDRMTPRLALVAKDVVLRHIAENVLNAYVGPDAGRRVMRGDIHRGAMEMIRAAVLYTDLRGYTAITDSADGETMAQMLDGYFEAIVPPILDRGGEVMKYLGDGLLATFNVDGRGGEEVCREALEAADEQIARVAELNARRSAAGAPVMDLDVALHLGDVLYGNVGAADRLDFTVIGPAVNEASRIEALCARLGKNLLVSDTFAQAAGAASAGRLVSVGRHKLRGVRGTRELFAATG